MSFLIMLQNLTVKKKKKETQAWGKRIFLGFVRICCGEHSSE